MSTTAKSPNPKVTDAATVLITHPLRVEIVERLAAAGRLSPSEMRRNMEAAGRRNAPTLSAISYHFQQLGKARLIRRAGSRKTRGTVEHFWMFSPAGVKALDNLLSRLDEARQRITLPTSG